MCGPRVLFDGHPLPYFDRSRKIAPAFSAYRPSLAKTPNANLRRVMRHINGVYTQRYTRMKRTDGPLFRGRYKAILVSQDEYLLQLS